LLATSTNEKHKLLEIEELAVYFDVGGSFSVPLLTKRAAYVRAVDGVTIDAGAGETVAVVGESGCGKSTLARAVLGLIESKRGSVRIRGQDRATFKHSKDRFKIIQMVFQDPDSSLDPSMKVKDTVSEPLVGLSSMSKDDREKKAAEVLNAVGLDSKFLDRLPRQLSGGQKQRVNIARAIVTEPSLVILDEPTSALDASVQAQILNLLLELQLKYNLSYLIITHNISVAEYLSDRTYVMYAGKVVEHGPTNAVIKDPRHPYTIALITSAPIPDPKERNLLKVEIVGEVPSVVNPPSGCRFHPRCPYAEQKCSDQEPLLEPIGPRRLAACHFIEKTAKKAGKA
jgi:oligopeptide/dipeptide ABC transporter ATP-binding protein